VLFVPQNVLSVILITVEIGLITKQNMGAQSIGMIVLPNVRPDRPAPNVTAPLKGIFRLLVPLMLLVASLVSLGAVILLIITNTGLVILILSISRLIGVTLL